jgi:thiol-disulfide isomerase/thioredoxin
MTRILTAATCAALLLLSGCSDSKQESRQQAPEKANALVASTAYDLRTLDGQAITVTKEGSLFKTTGVPESVVVFDIFATWCPPCRAEAPHLSSLQKKFAGKIRIVGLSIEENKDDAYFKRFAEENDITYTLVNSDDNGRLARAIAGAIGVGRDFPIPLMVVYKDGRYVKHYSGLVPEEMLESDFRQLVK